MSKSVWTDATLDEHVHKFLDGSLPHEQWAPHDSHLATTVWHVRKFPGDALDRMRNGIKHWNGLHGLADRYHETVTCFYVKVIERLVERLDPTLGVAELANAVIAELGLEREARMALWARYYSNPKAVIDSSEARRSWVAPDLETL